MDNGVDGQLQVAVSQVAVVYGGIGFTHGSATHPDHNIAASIVMGNRARRIHAEIAIVVSCYYFIFNIFILV